MSLLTQAARLRLMSKATGLHGKVLRRYLEIPRDAREELFSSWRDWCSEHGCVPGSPLATGELTDRVNDWEGLNKTS